MAPHTQLLQVIFFDLLLAWVLIQLVLFAGFRAYDWLRGPVGQAFS